MPRHPNPIAEMIDSAFISTDAKNPKTNRQVKRNDKETGYAILGLLVIFSVIVFVGLAMFGVGVLIGMLL
jgi:hypothetical protein